MWKKAALGLTALLLTTVSSLNLCCRVSIAGQPLEGLYSPAQVDAGVQAAAAAMEEILPEAAENISIERRAVLSLYAPRGESRNVSDAILRTCTGVAAVSAVYVDGMRMGVVADEAQLRERLDNFIVMQQPTKAVRSMINGKLAVTPFYSRSGMETNYDDMVLLITGKAHVMYMDENGKFV